MDVTPQSVIKYLVRQYSEDQYYTGLLAIHRKIRDPAVFWPVFWELWILSERHFLDGQEVRRMMTLERLFHESRRTCLPPEEREVLTALPDVVEVFRGCCESNSQGWSWTLSDTIALKFANALPVDEQPLVVEGLVSKIDILAYLNARNEQEVVTDPDTVRVRRRHRLPRRKATTGQQIAFMARTGTLDTPEIKDFADQCRVFFHIDQFGIAAYTKFCTDMEIQATRWGDLAKIREWQRNRERGIAYTEGRLDTPAARSFYEQRAGSGSRNISPSRA